MNRSIFRQRSLKRIELLVAIFIITLLIALFLPTVKKAKQVA